MEQASSSDDEDNVNWAAGDAAGDGDAPVAAAGARDSADAPADGARAWRRPLLRSSNSCSGITAFSNELVLGREN